MAQVKTPTKKVQPPKKTVAKKTVAKEEVLPEIPPAPVEKVVEPVTEQEKKPLVEKVERNIKKKNVPARTAQPKKGKVAPPVVKKVSIVENVEEKKLRAPRKKVTMENYLEKCDALLLLLDGEVERKQKEREKGARVFRSVRKTVRELKVDAPKLANTRRKTYTGEKRVSGLELKCKISDELADFMQVKRGSIHSRNDITKAICAYIHIGDDEHRSQVLEWTHLNPGGKRNLQNPADRMKIIPDEKLNKLLGYDQYKIDVENGRIKESVTNKKTRKREVVTVVDPSLKYYVVQRLIRKQIEGTIKMEKMEPASE